MLVTETTNINSQEYLTYLSLIGQEVWRPVVGYEPLYAVSNLGRVKRLAKISVRKSNEQGRIARLAERVCKPREDRRKEGKELLVINLNKAGRRSARAVRRLVAEAFMTDFDPTHYVGHRDGDFTNCALWNLVVTTPNDRNQNRDDGAFQQALTQAEVLLIDELADEMDWTLSQIHETFFPELSLTAIFRCYYRQSYKDVPRRSTIIPVPSKGVSRSRKRIYMPSVGTPVPAVAKCTYDLAATLLLKNGESAGS